MLRTKIILALGKISDCMQQHSDIHSTSTKPKATASTYLVRDFDPDVWLPGTVCFSVLSFTKKTWIRTRFSWVRVSNSYTIVHDIPCLKEMENFREEEIGAKISSAWNDKELEAISYSKNSPASLQQNFISLCFPDDVVPICIYNTKRSVEQIVSYLWAG